MASLPAIPLNQSLSVFWFYFLLAPTTLVPALGLQIGKSKFDFRVCAMDGNRDVEMVSGSTRPILLRHVG